MAMPVVANDSLSEGLGVELRRSEGSSNPSMQPASHSGDEQASDGNPAERS